MSVTLQGGCRVSEMREGPCSTHGTLSIWQQIGRAVSAKAISLRTLEFQPGHSPALRNDESDEVLYFLESLESNLSHQPLKAAITIDSQSFEVEPQTGIYLRPGQTMTVDNPGPNGIVFVSCQCPEPQSTVTTVTERIQGVSTNIDGPPAIVKLSDRATIPTGDRWYRVLVDDEVGSAQVTQFVGSIPPGRARDHFHNYEEVLFILHGKGRMWAGDTNTSIEAGSCVYLPKGQIHCVENTGDDELRLLGVFYPAGSPSVRYEV
jgi:mannose-6-phosphate isomerase-like protein (cupin superfamily)